MERGASRAGARRRGGRHPTGTGVGENGRSPSARHRARATARRGTGNGSRGEGLRARRAVRHHGNPNPEGRSTGTEVDAEGQLVRPEPRPGRNAVSAHPTASRPPDTRARRPLARAGRHGPGREPERSAEGARQYARGAAGRRGRSSRRLFETALPSRGAGMRRGTGPPGASGRTGRATSPGSGRPPQLRCARPSAFCATVAGLDADS